MIDGRKEKFKQSVECVSYAVTCGGRMWRAIKKGNLNSQIGLACNDCGKTARVNEHRDYDKWWEFVPACMSCNVKRGRAAPFKHLHFSTTSVNEPNKAHEKHLDQFALSMLEATTEPFE